MGADEEGTLARAEGDPPRAGRSEDRRAPRPHRQDDRRRAAGRVRQRRRRGALRGRGAARDGRAQCRRAGRRERIEFRIGINLGDIIVEGDDIYGDGVNIAARLEGTGRAGRDLRHPRACATRSATSSISRSTIMGEQQVKNIARPVRVYRVRLGQRAGECRVDRPPLRAARQAVARGAAVPEHERRPGAGVFRRRHRRGHHHRVARASLAVRHRPQFELHLQGQAVDVKQVGARAGRALRARRQRAQGRQPGAHHGQLIDAATGAISGPTAMTARPRRHFRLAGPGHDSVVGAIEPQLLPTPRSSGQRKPTESLDA